MTICSESTYKNVYERSFIIYNNPAVPQPTGTGQRFDILFLERGDLFLESGSMAVCNICGIPWCYIIDYSMA
jgi:hypothetical protein